MDRRGCRRTARAAALVAAVARRRGERRESPARHSGCGHPRNLVGRPEAQHRALIAAEEEEPVARDVHRSFLRTDSAPQPVVLALPSGPTAANAVRVERRSRGTRRRCRGMYWAGLRDLRSLTLPRASVLGRQAAVATRNSCNASGNGWQVHVALRAVYVMRRRARTRPRWQAAGDEIDTPPGRFERLWHPTGPAGRRHDEVGHLTPLQRQLEDPLVVPTSLMPALCTSTAAPPPRPSAFPRHCRSPAPIDLRCRCHPAERSGLREGPESWSIASSRRGGWEIGTRTCRFRP